MVGVREEVEVKEEEIVEEEGVKMVKARVVKVVKGVKVDKVVSPRPGPGAPDTHQTPQNSAVTAIISMVTKLSSAWRR